MIPRPRAARQPVLARAHLTRGSGAKPPAASGGLPGAARIEWQREATDPVGIVATFAEAFNRRDVDGLVAMFTPGATYDDGFYGRHAGHPDLRAMFARMFREGRDYAWRMDAIVEAPDRAMAEWTFSYVVTDAIPRSAGRRIAFRGMSVFDLSGGRIAAYREYFDSGPALLQLGFAPESLAKVLRRKLASA